MIAGDRVRQMGRPGRSGIIVDVLEICGRRAYEVRFDGDTQLRIVAAESVVLLASNRYLAALDELHLWATDPHESRCDSPEATILRRQVLKILKKHNVV